MSKVENHGLSPRLREMEGPVFDEPWQAQVLALAYGLAESGMFSPAQWSQALGAELKKAETAGKPDDQNTYYEAALIALEQLVALHGDVRSDVLTDRIETWRRAYLNTPHGQPVELEAGLEG